MGKYFIVLLLKISLNRASILIRYCKIVHQGVFSCTIASIQNCMFDFYRKISTRMEEFTSFENAESHQTFEEHSLR